MISFARHRQNPATPEEIADLRLNILERQVRDLSIANVKAENEHRAQAAIIRRRNAQVALLGETLRRLLLAYCALGRVRDTSRPARVLDTGTPGVEVTPR
ncbi:hypothetical protein [Actinacidiphila rubida]|uniref:Uncharacterized protein n=1 Tax=Actinacidiphila rubida TaxID=310780 RepID=A0A1H8SWN9_9ACTN|nr:hypothetical protein [Actinacidiphila rubida]SEO82945.1 hypothetical protein SAMN05216267_104616 [Actinacidiphila rubida]